jgi:hypothetical protein
VRIIVKVGLLPTEKGEGLMITANIETILAISNLCSTVDQVVAFRKSLQAAHSTPIKDRP